jgi:LacI family transcriptional regulator
MNIVQFSRLIGISTATVSRAFHEPDKLRGTTLARVLREARRWGYFPNPAGRVLVRGKHDTLGMVWPLEVEGAEAVFAQRILAAVTRALVEYDQDLLLCPIDRSTPPTVAHARRTIQRSKCDAWLLLYPRDEDPLIGSLRDSRRPVISLMGRLKTVSWWKNITLNQAAWVKDALCRLQKGGARHVVFLGCRPGEPDHHERMRQFQHWASRCFSRSSVKIPPWPVRPSDLVTWLKKGKPDAILAVDDLTALAALRACHRLSIHVPSQLQLIGFDDHPESAISKPRLTTYRQPLETMAKAAVRLALGLRIPSCIFHPTFVPGDTIRISDRGHVVNGNPTSNRESD